LRHIQGQPLQPVQQYLEPLERVALRGVSSNAELAALVLNETADQPTRSAACWLLALCSPKLTSASVLLRALETEPPLVRAEAANLLGREGVAVNGLRTLGRFVRHPRPAYIERWIGLLSRCDWVRWLPVTHPDRIIELPGARHNDYATRHANVVVEVTSDFTAGVRGIIAQDGSSEWPGRNHQLGQV
jgi:hypothetical protein